MQWNKLTHFLTCAAFLALTACGESSDDEVTSIIDGSGAPVPDVAVTGSINGFGSVVVDGVHYETDDATVIINGDEASEEDLKVGDYITLYAVNDDVSGKINATVIYSESAVRGAVTAVDIDDGIVEVHGRSVRISRDTLFGSDFSERSIQGIHIGDVIEVGGAHNTQGSVYASRVDKLTENIPLLSGKIDSLDSQAYRFLIAGVVVDYSQAASHELKNGQWVAVSGSYDTNQDVFTATSIRLRLDRSQLPSGILLKVDGIAENLTGFNFQLDGREIVLTPSTEFINGSGSNLMNGTPVFVEGIVNEQGSVEASSVRFKIWNFVEINGTIENIELQTVYWYLDQGFLIVDGKKIHVDGSTVLFGRGGDFYRGRAYLFELLIGDRVKVVADAMPIENEWIARVIEIDREIIREPPPPPPMPKSH